jgi:uncharacterized OsmC-like protein
MDMYRVDVENRGSSQFTVKSGDYEFIIDTKGNGVTPPDALLASVASCLGVYLRKYAEGAKIDIPEFVITAEAEFTKEFPVRFDRIRVVLDLKGIRPDERRMASLLEFVKNCPVHNTLRNKPDVEVAIR